MAGSVWFRLVHARSGLMLVMLPPRAAEGAWMLRLVPSSEAAAGTDTFCAERADAPRGCADEHRGRRMGDADWEHIGGAV